MGYRATYPIMEPSIISKQCRETQSQSPYNGLCLRLSTRCHAKEADPSPQLLLAISIFVFNKGMAQFQSVLQQV